MSENKYTGEVSLEICGKKCVLVYDWRALSQIYSEYGREKLRNLFDLSSPEELAGILAIGLKKNNPEVTKEIILDNSPPVVQIIAAIDKALAVAYMGAETAAALERLSAEEVKKKTI